MPDPLAFRLARCEMELKDGRVLDLSGLTVEEALTRLREAGVTPPDVKETRHFIRWTRRKKEDR